MLNGERRPKEENLADCNTRHIINSSLSRQDDLKIERPTDSAAKGDSQSEGSSIFLLQFLVLAAVDEQLTMTFERRYEMYDG